MKLDKIKEKLGEPINELSARDKILLNKSEALENISIFSRNVLNSEEKEEVKAIVSDKLLTEVSSCIGLNEYQREHLRTYILRVYEGYFSTLKISKDLTTFEERHKALKTVCNTAVKLADALEAIKNIPEANEKFIKEFSYIGQSNPERLIPNFTLLGLVKENDNPVAVFKDIIDDIAFAADEAAFDWKKFYKNFGEYLENDDEDRDGPQDLYIAYSERKYIPIRAALLAFKSFWEEHTEESFTAGTYYKEIGGYNSPTIEALEMLLLPIIPDISQRNIVTHMQVLNA